MGFDISLAHRRAIATDDGGVSLLIRRAFWRCSRCSGSASSQAVDFRRGLAPPVRWRDVLTQHGLMVIVVEARSLDCASDLDFITHVVPTRAGQGFASDVLPPGDDHA